MRRQLSFAARAVCCLAMVVLLSRCDIPTESPDFSLTTSVKAPLILDKTFVLLGPDESGLTPLIDSTDASFDTLFSVDPSNNKLLINQELDDLDIGDLDDLISEISLDPITVSVSIGSLDEQSFSTETFGSDVGLFTSPEITIPSAPVNPSVPSYPIGNVLVPPTVDLINLSDVSVESVRLSSSTSNVNQFQFTLANSLGSGTLTNSSGGVPEVILERPDGGSVVEIARASFNTSPAPGQQATALMDVAGSLLTADATYRLDVTTTEGDTPMTTNPTGVQVTTLVRPLEYAETGVSDVPAQSDIDASGDALSLGGDTEFSGIIAAGGFITINIANNLPFDVTLTELTARNLEDVGAITAPSVMFNLDDLPSGTSRTIPTGMSVDLNFPMAGKVISSEIEVEVLASSPGTGSSAILRDSDGLFTTVTGNVEVDELYFIPDAEEFTSNGVLDIDVDDVSFESGQEFVELESGTLLIEEITNEMNMDMETLRFSLPGFRVPPYSPADSLVIQFQGSSQNPASFQYSQLTGETTIENIAIDLANVRIYPVDNQANYNVFAVSEAGQPTNLSTTDQIRASLAPQNMQISRVEAIMTASAIDLTEDANNDGVLEIMSNAEAEVMDLGSLSELNQYDLDGFQFNGAQFTFNVNTNLGADIIFYAAMVGIDADGSPVYLQGQNEFAVSSSDTLAQDFVFEGAPIAPENLIKFTIPGSPSVDQVVTQVIEINQTNSNLDAFISSLPEEFRYVGKGLVQGTSGGLVQLQKPFTMEASIGAGIPLSFTGSFSADETIDADLSSLEDLTDPDADVLINEGNLELVYENGLPVEVGVQVDILDEWGQPILTLPDSSGTSYTLNAAPADDAGLSTDTAPGTLAISITEEQLRTISRGQEAQIRFQINTNEDTPATLRASDTIQVRLLGKFDLTVQVK